VRRQFTPRAEAPAVVVETPGEIQMPGENETPGEKLFASGVVTFDGGSQSINRRNIAIDKLVGGEEHVKLFLYFNQKL